MVVELGFSRENEQMVDKPTPLDWERMSRVNAGLAERLFNEGLHLAYDEDGDTLLITIGEEQPSMVTHVIEGIFLCVHPETLLIVGCTIVAFESDLLANNKLMRKLFPDAMKILRQKGGIMKWQGREAQRMMPIFELAMSR
jgi:hypothetical protein